MVLLPGPPGREAWAALNPPIDAKMPVPGDASVKYVQGPRGPSKASTSIRVSKLTVTAVGGSNAYQTKPPQGSPHSTTARHTPAPGPSTAPTPNTSSSTPGATATH